MARPKTQFELDDGTYIFDCIGFRTICKRFPKKEKGALKKKFIDKTGYEEDSVKEWIYGHNGPTYFKTVEILAECLYMKPKQLLKQISDKENKEEKSEMKITVAEGDRTGARILYGELCEMLQLLERELPDNPRSEEPIPVIRKDVSYKYKNQEEARNHYLLCVKKASLDIPAQMREDLKELIEKCFGDWDPFNNEMFRQNVNYQEYLQERNLEDTPENKEIYESTFISLAEQELDEIFKDYIMI